MTWHYLFEASHDVPNKEENLVRKVVQEHGIEAVGLFFWNVIQNLGFKMTSIYCCTSTDNLVSKEITIQFTIMCTINFMRYLLVIMANTRMCCVRNITDTYDLSKLFLDICLVIPT